MTDRIITELAGTLELNAEPWIGMIKDEHIVAEILRVLKSAEIPPAEWSTTLAKVQAATEAAREATVRDKTSSHARRGVRSRAQAEASETISMHPDAGRLFGDPPPALRAESAEPARPEWKEAKKRGDTLPDFIMSAYASEIEAGTLTKATLRADRELYTDYFNWRRRQNLPPELHWLRDLPTQTEMDDQRFAAAGIDPTEVSIEDFSPPEREVIRRYEAARKRTARARAPQA